MTQHTAAARSDWQAAVDSLFGGLGEELAGRAAILADADVRTRLRLFIDYFVRYAARHPEQMRLMVQEGTADSPSFAEHARLIQNTYGMNRYGTSSQ